MTSPMSWHPPGREAIIFHLHLPVVPDVFVVSFDYVKTVQHGVTVAWKCVAVLQILSAYNGVPAAVFYIWSV